MKRVALPFIALSLALGLSGCNPAADQAALSPAVPVAVAPVPVAPSNVVAQDDMQSQPPIYTPLVDMEGKSQARFDRDHSACRKIAEPQEKAAREAMQQQQAGQAIAIAGAMAGFLPVRGFNQAVNVTRASNAAQDLGGNIAAGGAARGANATDDYALIVNNCMSRRGWFLLRA